MTVQPRTYAAPRPKIIGLVGASGSGKTDLACRLIEHLSKNCAVIFAKHTHHSLNADPSRGDTARAVAAGARAAYLVGPEGAIRFDPEMTAGAQIDLFDIESLDADVVVAEGFRHETWPKVLVETFRSDDRAAGAGPIRGVVSRQAGNTTTPRFSPEDLSGIANLFEACS